MVNVLRGKVASFLSRKVEIRAKYREIKLYVPLLRDSVELRWNIFDSEGNGRDHDVARVRFLHRGTYDSTRV